MQPTETFLIIIGIAAGTYAVRALPFVYRFVDRLPIWGRRLLAAIPPAALGALLIPGAAAAVPGRPLIGIAAAAAALLTGLRSRHIIVPVGIAILLAYLLIQY
ncbi:AzlD domain-containing protein [Spirochaeta africana]|uniref:Putative membrane protein n=1 Tax=Spirochaeta africana (strain ATCC 700263 / DSM 8902 / Z-7692) TaxID=889378 RepID=H9UL36_SPIAZ|nr:AzlD domain-containing protein [Spirochaeta africana]AFG38229.1 putative membrane protein [Spirochaeta africana DSM 8902]